MPIQYRTEDGEVFIQCGMTALRDPVTGTPLEGVPMFIKVPQEEVNEETGISKGEEKTMDDVARIFADNMKKYAEGGLVSGWGQGIMEVLKDGKP